MHAPNSGSSRRISIPEPDGPALFAGVDVEDDRDLGRLRRAQRRIRQLETRVSELLEDKERLQEQVQTLTRTVEFDRKHMELMRKGQI